MTIPHSLPTDLRFFELVEGLVPGGQALAVELIFVNNVWVPSGDMRTVVDPTGLMAIGIFSRIYCIRNEQSSEWHPLMPGRRFPVRITARTEITNPGWGESSLTGVYDWKLVRRKAIVGIWEDVPGGAHGEYANFTGIIEMQFTNHGLEYLGKKVVFFEPFPIVEPAQESSEESSEEAGGYIGFFDEAATNMIPD